MMKEDVAFRLEQGISSENALVLNGLATFRVVGKPRVILKVGLRNSVTRPNLVR